MSVLIFHRRTRGTRRGPGLLQPLPGQLLGGADGNSAMVHERPVIATRPVMALAGLLEAFERFLGIGGCSFPVHIALAEAAAPARPTAGAGLPEQGDGAAG